MIPGAKSGVGDCINLMLLWIGTIGTHLTFRHRYNPVWLTYSESLVRVISDFVFFVKNVAYPISRLFPCIPFHYLEYVFRSSQGARSVGSIHQLD